MPSIHPASQPADRPPAVAREGGQASVELLGTLPAVLLVGLVVWQLALAGHTAWLCAHAARAAARAAVVRADPEAAARSALPRTLGAGTTVERAGAGVRVEVAVPLVVPTDRTVRIGATAALVEGAG